MWKDHLHKTYSCLRWGRCISLFDHSISHSPCESMDILYPGRYKIWNKMQLSPGTLIFKIKFVTHVCESLYSVKDSKHNSVLWSCSSENVNSRAEPTDHFRVHVVVKQQKYIYHSSKRMTDSWSRAP